MYAWFSEEELKRLSTPQLKVVANYFGVSYTKRKVVIAALLQLWKGSDEGSENTLVNNAPVSVQVQRIYDSLKENK